MLMYGIKNYAPEVIINADISRRALLCCAWKKLLLNNGRQEKECERANLAALKYFSLYLPHRCIFSLSFLALQQVVFSRSILGGPPHPRTTQWAVLLKYINSSLSLTISRGSFPPLAGVFSLIRKERLG